MDGKFAIRLIALFCGLALCSFFGCADADRGRVVELTIPATIWAREPAGGNLILLGKSPDEVRLPDDPASELVIQIAPEATVEMVRNLAASHGGLPWGEVRLDWQTSVSDELIAEVCELRNLRKLVVSDASGLSGEGCFEVATNLRLVHLQMAHLKLSALDLEEFLSQLGTMQSLKRLDLSSSRGWTAASMKNLAQIEALEFVSLWGCTEVDDKMLSLLIPLSSLREVSLVGTSVTERGVEFFHAHSSAVVSGYGAPGRPGK